MKDSLMAGSVTLSYTENYQHLREKLLADKIVVAEEGGVFRFTKDTLFSSPSTAASIIMGRCANGLLEWKTDDGRILKMLETE